MTSLDEPDAADDDTRNGGTAGSSLMANASGVITLVGPVTYGSGRCELVGGVGVVVAVVEEPNAKSEERRLWGDGGEEVDGVGVEVPETLAEVELELVEVDEAEEDG